MEEIEFWNKVRQHCKFVLGFCDWCCVVWIACLGSVSLVFVCFRFRFFFSPNSFLFVSFLLLLFWQRVDEIFGVVETLISFCLFMNSTVWTLFLDVS